MLPAGIPDLSFTGGAAAPATSGNVGTAGNIGNTVITKKGGVSIWVIAAGVAVFFLAKKFG